MAVGMGVVVAIIGGSVVWQNWRQKRKETEDARHMGGGIPTWQYRIFQVNNPDLVSHLPKTSKAGVEQGVRGEQAHRPIINEHNSSHMNVRRFEEKYGPNHERKYTQPTAQRSHTYDDNLVYTKKSSRRDASEPVGDHMAKHGERKPKGQPNPTSLKNPDFPSGPDS